MNFKDSIHEEHTPEITTLQVYHRRLRVPKDIYLQSVDEFTDPWNERAYQHFIQNYLNEYHDQGIVGMVRQEQDSVYVYLDAAIRYPTHTNTEAFY